jgi:hypothetical protein
MLRGGELRKSWIGRGERLVRVALLFDFRLLAAKVAQVVQLRATNVSARDYLDVVDDRGVNREGSLDADLEADLANAERLANAFAGAADNDTLKDLDARAGALDDVYVNLHVVAGTEVRDVGAK